MGDRKHRIARPVAGAYKGRGEFVASPRPLLIVRINLLTVVDVDGHPNRHDLKKRLVSEPRNPNTTMTGRIRRDRRTAMYGNAAIEIARIIKRS